MTKLIIVRHGETEANVRQVWQGSLDAPLTRRGEIQAQATGRRMAELNREHPVDHFYVSPLPRAQSTAAAIAAAIGMEPEIYAGVSEFDLGDWEGRTFVDLKETEDLWNRWAADPTFAPPSGESPATFAERIEQAFADLAAEHPQATILVVTHGGVISNLLARRLGVGPQDWRNWESHNCAITVIEQDGSGWRSVLVNDIQHLPPAARNQEDASLYELDEQNDGTDHER
ncbi:MAG: histidine phosphatase family protein [Caldilineaceae bacterium]|nr:histidine phosphatase family protein [Caldilineaceae bacterium]